MRLFGVPFPCSPYTSSLSSIYPSPHPLPSPPPPPPVQLLSFTGRRRLPELILDSPAVTLVFSAHQPWPRQAGQLGDRSAADVKMNGHDYSGSGGREDRPAAGGGAVQAGRGGEGGRGDGDGGTASGPYLMAIMKTGGLRVWDLGPRRLFIDTSLSPLLPEDSTDGVLRIASARLSPAGVPSVTIIPPATYFFDPHMRAWMASTRPFPLSRISSPSSRSAQVAGATPASTAAKLPFLLNSSSRYLMSYGVCSLSPSPCCHLVCRR